MSICLLVKHEHCIFNLKQGQICAIFNVDKNRYLTATAARNQKQEPFQNQLGAPPWISPTGRQGYISYILPCRANLGIFLCPPTTIYCTSRGNSLVLKNLHKNVELDSILDQMEALPWASPTGRQGDSLPCQANLTSLCPPTILYVRYTFLGIKKNHCFKMGLGGLHRSVGCFFLFLPGTPLQADREIPSHAPPFLGSLN